MNGPMTNEVKYMYTCKEKKYSSISRVKKKEKRRPLGGEEIVHYGIVHVRRARGGRKREMPSAGWMTLSTSYMRTTMPDNRHPRTAPHLASACSEG